MKRTLATALWFLAGWVVGSAAAWLLGVTPLLGPITAVAAAAFVGFDPRHLFWTPSAARSRARLGATTAPTFEAERLS